jgi:hypothetical protein
LKNSQIKIGLLRANIGFSKTQSELTIAIMPMIDSSNMKRHFANQADQWSAELSPIIFIVSFI